MKRVTSLAFVISSFGTVIGVAGLMLLPLSSAALGIPPNYAGNGTTATSPFCSKVSTDASTIASKAR